MMGCAHKRYAHAARNLPRDRRTFRNHAAEQLLAVPSPTVTLACMVHGACSVQDNGQGHAASTLQATLLRNDVFHRALLACTWLAAVLLRFGLDVCHGVAVLWCQPHAGWRLAVMAEGWFVVNDVICKAITGSDDSSRCLLTMEWWWARDMSQVRRKCSCVPQVLACTSMTPHPAQRHCSSHGSSNRSASPHLTFSRYVQ